MFWLYGGLSAISFGSFHIIKKPSGTVCDCPSFSMIGPSFSHLCSTWEKFVRHERKNVHHPEKNVHHRTKNVHHRSRCPSSSAICPKSGPNRSLSGNDPVFELPQNALQLRRSIRPQIFPQIMNGPRRKNGGFPAGLPAKRNMCRSGLAPSQGRLFLNPPAGKEAGRDGTWMEPPIILEPGGGNRVRIFPANFSRPVPLKTPDHRK